MSASTRRLTRRAWLALALAASAGATVRPSSAASAKEIDLEVDAALERFYSEVRGAKAFAASAAGLLVFPSVIKAGLLIGGEYGEGALRVGGRTVDYYSTAAASFGLQAGAQSKTVIIAFMDEGALAAFRASAGWKAGVDGSVAVVKTGTGGAVDTDNIRDPIVAFVFGNKGLMFNVTLEGSKFTRLDR